MNCVKLCAETTQNILHLQYWLRLYTRFCRILVFSWSWSVFLANKQPDVTSQLEHTVFLLFFATHPWRTYGMTLSWNCLKYWYEYIYELTLSNYKRVYACGIVKIDHIEYHGSRWAWYLWCHLFDHKKSSAKKVKMPKRTFFRPSVVVQLVFGKDSLIILIVINQFSFIHSCYLGKLLSIDGLSSDDHHDLTK